MNKKREVSSTDRLLGKITNRSAAAPHFQKNADGSAYDQAGSAAHSRKKTGGNMKNRFFSSTRQPQAVSHPGIIIGKEGIALILPGTGMIDTPFISGINAPYAAEQTDIFNESFKHTLSALLAEIPGDQRAGVWCSLPDYLVDIRYLKVPKARDKDLENAIYWSYKKEMVAEESDTFFDYEISGEFTERGVSKVGVCACSVHQDVVTRLTDLFAGSGCMLSGITTNAFAVQTLLRREVIIPGHENICCVHIGRESSSINIFVNGNLMLVRQVRAGLSSLAETILSETEKDSLQLEGDVPKDAVQTAMQRIIDHIRSKGRTADTVSDELFLQVAPAVDRIGRQIERTLDYFRQNIYAERVSAVLIHGEVSEYRPFLETIAELLAIPVYSPPDVLTAEMTYVHTEAVKQSPHFLSGLGLIHASNETTPNILFTHKDKQAYRKTARLNNGILGAAAVLLVICGLVFSYQINTLSGLKKEKKALASAIAGLPADINRSALQELADTIVEKKQRLKKKAAAMETRGLLNALISHTPDAIKLSTLVLTMDNDREIGVTGYVFSDAYSQDSVLAGYVMDLVESALFSRVTVTHQQKERLGSKEVLRFSATIDI
ncbi:MAG: hypothetical protein SWH68_00270 [Thermodesulfobacteriota bacterium]|nr:hypothetical protein [Thermodesulfobacteriota bacterium]